MNNSEKTSQRVTRIIIILSIIIAAISTYVLINIDLVDKPIAGQGAELIKDKCENDYE